VHGRKYSNDSLPENALKKFVPLGSTDVIIAAMTHIFNMGRLRQEQFHVLAALLLLGCGSDAGGGNPGTNTQTSDGQVTDPWRGYCTATFKSDVAIKDVFGDTAFTAHTGEQYLLTQFDTTGGSPRVQIAYLTSLGPDTYDVPITGGTDTFPFTSNCTIDNTVQYLVAFTNVTLYAAQDLANKICDIPAGTAMQRDMTANSGSSTVGFGLSGPQTYDIMLNVFSTMCGNATDGYASVPETQALGVNTWLIPIDVLLKAK
jgi:hypothetical protein